MSESRAMPYLRALGWAAFAGAPILLAALAVIASRPNAPAALATNAAIAAWIAGTLAFVASIVWQRGGARVARIVAGLSALVVISFSAFLVWLALALGEHVVALEVRDLDDDALVARLVTRARPRCEPSERAYRSARRCSS